MIVRAELEKDSLEEEQESNGNFNKRKFIQTTPNSKLFTSLFEAMEKDFIDAVQEKINSFKKVYFLPTTRGRNREWFIDEQNSEEIQIVENFHIYLKQSSPIQSFVNFWIGTEKLTN
jgi:hypothetical protein